MWCFLLTSLFFVSYTKDIVPDGLWFVQVKFCKPKWCHLFRGVRLSSGSSSKPAMLVQAFCDCPFISFNIYILTKASRAWAQALTLFGNFPEYWAVGWQGCPFPRRFCKHTFEWCRPPNQSFISSTWLLLVFLIPIEAIRVFLFHMAVCIQYIYFSSHCVFWPSTESIVSAFHRRRWNCSTSVNEVYGCTS